MYTRESNRLKNLFQGPTSNIETIASDTFVIVIVHRYIPSPEQIIYQILTIPTITQTPLIDRPNYASLSFHEISFETVRNLPQKPTKYDTADTGDLILDTITAGIFKLPYCTSHHDLS